MAYESLRAALLETYLEARSAAEAAPSCADPQAAASAANLLAYAAMRKRDLSDIQLQLADAGLSSLGRLEGQVLRSLEQVLAWLGPLEDRAEALDRAEAEQLLAARSRALFGRPRPARDTRIMVTLDHEVAEQPTYIRELLLAGMDIARINCSHGCAADWRRLVSTIRDVEAELTRQSRPPARHCRVMCDLAGPHLRVGRVPPGLRLEAGTTVRFSRTADASPSDDPAIPVLTSTLPAAFALVEPGHRLFMDDGRFEGVVTSVNDRSVLVRITAPTGKGRRLKPEKGMNLPDTPILLPALSERDRQDLAEVIDFVDAVGLSFVHEPGDVVALHEALKALGRPNVGIVAKIETRRAARNLTGILLAGLVLPAFGVMIARGDLAVEIGFDDLATIQENILCLCEAAHVPAIWATQVLETLAHSGLPARAEMTDAAASKRADCVMLNKGPHVAAAVAMLDRVLSVEQRRRQKKRQLFRDFMTQEPPATFSTP